MGSRLESGSHAVRKRIENHVFEDEEGEEYEASNFGGFGDYFRRKKLKLQNLDEDIRSSSPNNPPIFRGVVAHVNGYTQPSLNDLHKLIVSHGGGFLQYLDNKTSATHIIASALTPKKREEFRKYRVVKPAWVVESINAGRLLPWESFRVIDEPPSQKILKFAGDGRITNETNRLSTGYREQTASSWYTSQLKQSETHDVDRDPPFAPEGAPQNGVEDEENLARQPSTPTCEAPPSSHTPDDLDPMASGLGGETERKAVEADIPLYRNLAEEHFERTDPHPDNVEASGGKEMSPEEYNAQLLANPQMRNSSVVNPDFIQQYYRESRLHHLSTWKAELKAQLQASAQERGLAGRAPRKRVPGSRRYILHVDFDSFFAAVCIRKHPELVDKPVAVAHGTGTGSEIASCNYPARSFGVRNGMWMKGALQMCPELKVLPYDFEAYEDASRKFYEAILDIGGIVQSVSIDEALVDITTQCLEAGGSEGRDISEGSIFREQATADKIAQGLRDSIKEKTGCHVSVGIGANILQAKVALRKAKPARQFQLKPEAVLDYIGGLTVQDLPGVAYSLGAKLEELGVKFVKDIRELTKEKLTSSLGPKTGVKLWDYARGVDHTEVGDQSIRKSVSAEINWGIRFVTQTQAEEFVQGLCDELRRRLMENAVKGRQLTMRIMRRAADAPHEPPKHLGHGKCDTYNKSVALGIATNASDIIGKEAISILRSFKFSPGDLRGLGVQMTKLEPIKQTPSGQLDSSQKQLSFKPSSPAHKRTKPLDPDEVDSPQKAGLSTQDASDEAKMAPSLNDMSQRPLNVTGTQFIMPTQVDQNVLSELPSDIRSKLTSPQKQQKLEFGGSAIRRPQSPLVPPDLPPQSQLDREALAALPEDVRAEVLAHYEPQALASPSAQRSTAPARQNATSSRPRTATTPTKSRTTRRRGRPAASKSDRNSTLLQSNFLFPAATATATAAAAATAPATSSRALDDNADAATGPGADPSEEISPDFLDALPEDIRREVLEEHKRSRLQKRAGLNVPQQPRRLGPARTAGSSSTTQGERKTLQFPPRPPKPTFTSKKLSTLPELREAVGQWHEAFKDDGPYEEDVLALARYVKRVVLDERDVAKAVAVAEWLAWLVKDGSPASATPKEDEGDAPVYSWQKALGTIHQEINSGAEERGITCLSFT